MPMDYAICKNCPDVQVIPAKVNPQGVVLSPKVLVCTIYNTKLTVENLCPFGLTK